MKTFIYIAVAAALVVGGYFILVGTASTGESEYALSPVTRGAIESTVSATGTMSPVTTVAIGTQVSGTIDSVYVDFNDRVKTNQVLAVLDTALLKTQVLDAEASVERAEAALEEAEADFSRNRRLFDAGMISEAEFLPFQVALKTQQANAKSAEAALTRARRNLQYAVIKSPITGTVISKDVEAGQTVAASLSTPTLFIIAEDLSRMEILAEVDESDIGVIKEGQAVRFEIAPYANRMFSGAVRQIRLQPTVVSNVVTYIVVVSADNEEGLLLPGMTATVDFIVEQRSDVLMVSSKALRFRPGEEEAAAARERLRQRMESSADDSLLARRPRVANGGGDRSNRGMVWYVDTTGRLEMAPVRIGLTDGINTEIAGSRLLAEGMNVITGVESAESATRTTDRGPRMRGPRGF